MTGAPPGPPADRFPPGLVPDRMPALVLDPSLATVWHRGPAPAPVDELIGLVGPGPAPADPAAQAVVLAATRHPVEPDPAGFANLTARFGAALGSIPLRLVVISGGTLRALLRDWLYQVGDGSGRGVAIRTVTMVSHPGPPRAPVLQLTIDSWDSSAREVSLRLIAQGGTAAPEAVALARLLGCSEVLVRVADQDSTTH